jgi:hypothetical protein
MGGFRGSSGGSDTADERKQKSYSDQLKTEQRKQKAIDFIKGGGVAGSVIRAVVGAAKKSKQNVLDYEGQAAGVTPMRKRPPINTGGGRDDNPQGIEVAKQSGSLTAQTQMSAVDAAPDGPTNIEMPTEESEAERLLKIKRKGRRATILNVPDDELTLSKKVLLG